MASFTWHNVPWLRTSALTHRQKVKSLYKRLCRTCDDWFWTAPYSRADSIYYKTQVRAEFDKNKDIKDLRKAKVLLLDGEETLWKNLHPVPFKFAYSPGGICFERYAYNPDIYLDYWEPTEKAKYPYYFARREASKEKYVKMFEERWGVNAAVDLGVTSHASVVDPPTDEEKMYGKNGHFGEPVTSNVAKSTKKH